MYISYEWLKDLVKLPVKIKPEEIAARLTEHTVEVEGLVRQADKFNRVVVGKVLEVHQHPNADRLRLTTVDVKTAKLSIVCGAPNVAVGQLVAVALVGAVLPNGLEIKEAEIRGEKSHGMICAEDELNLGRNHAGIMVLQPTAKVGEPLARYLHAADIILEVDNKSLSNRPDLWSHYGLARELQAIFGAPLKPYSKLLGKFTFLNAKENKLSVKVDDPELCPRYQAVKIENIEIKESPDWLKQKLIAVGQRPINNVVDLTNYVMLEIGQPLHAFDGDKIQKILVRRAVKDEILETLDGEDRSLSADDLVITDGRRAIALAGIMGGKNSEISAGTKTVLLESANFDASGIRRTAQKLGLRSESSARFEKSLDPALTEIAILRFLTLLKESCPQFRLASAFLDINKAQTPPLVITLDLDWLMNKIGQEIPRAEVIDILEKLGFKIVAADRNLTVTIPSWRATKDVRLPEDLVEEVLRIYGYDKIVSRLPLASLEIPAINSERQLERTVKNFLAGKYALTEIYNYSLLGADQLTKLQIDFSNYLSVANPLSDLYVLLRQSLAPGLIGNLKNNQAQAGYLGFFEIGNVFFNAPGNFSKETAGGQTLPYQEKCLGLLAADETADSFGRLKGLIDNLLQNLSHYRLDAEFSVLNSRPGWADEKISAKITVLGQDLGFVAAVSDTSRRNINLKRSAAVLEINLSLLSRLLSGLPPFHYQAAPKYPPVWRDLALVVGQEILYNDLQQEISHFHPLIKSVELFDVYSGDQVAAGQKGLAFHITYQAVDRTLVAAEVDKIEKNLVAQLGKKWGATLREV